MTIFGMSGSKPVRWRMTAAASSSGIRNRLGKQGDFVLQMDLGDSRPGGDNPTLDGIP
jgi:hypothetical protein